MPARRSHDFKMWRYRHGATHVPHSDLPRLRDSRDLLGAGVARPLHQLKVMSLSAEHHDDRENRWWEHFVILGFLALAWFFFASGTDLFRPHSGLVSLGRSMIALLLAGVWIVYATATTTAMALMRQTKGPWRLHASVASVCLLAAFALVAIGGWAR